MVRFHQRGLYRRSVVERLFLMQGNRKKVSRMAKGKYEEWLEPEGLLKIEGWARDGLTEEQIAYNMGINRRTLTEWKSKYDPISHVLKRGKEVVDRQVENALLKRALGYEYEEVTQEFNEETGKLQVTKVVNKQVAPDTTAQIFWLKNRKPDEWREKKDVDVTVQKSEKLNDIFAQLGGEGLEE